MLTLHSDKPWSEMDIEDIKAYASKMSPLEMADLLMRDQNQVVEKARALGLEFGETDDDYRRKFQMH